MIKIGSEAKHKHQILLLEKTLETAKAITKNGGTLGKKLEPSWVNNDGTLDK